MDCWTCRSNSGERRISPGPTIFEGRYWLVEHAYPVGAKGWTVIVLKRHAEAVHELTPEEFSELARIQSRLVRLLFEELGCTKEYVSCFAEAEHFFHVHFHVFARPGSFPDELKGGRSFALIKVSEAESVPAPEVAQFCNHLRDRFGEIA